MEPQAEIKIEYEQNGINVSNEGSLHAQLKNWYFRVGDRLEAAVDGSIIDIVRDGQLIEIQTKNFSAIKKKIIKLLKKHKLTLVYPIASEKWIVNISKDDKMQLSKRKSPAKGNIYDIFNELVRIPELINNDNFSLEVLMIKVEEIRCNDGKGSWRRKGTSIVDRRLIAVLNSIMFREKKDFFNILPDEIDKSFTNKSLAKQLSISVEKTRKMTYCLRKIGLIKEAGKERNELVFEWIKLL